MAATFTVERNAGRLIEAKVRTLRTVQQVDEYGRALGEAMRWVPAGTRPVLCADHRAVTIYPAAVADRLTELFEKMNARLERVAILVARTNATLSMQLERIVREANNPSRRVFHEGSEAIEHLGEVLDVDERVRLGRFLS